MKLESPWKPRLADTGGLIHERLVQALAQDILSGALPSGARLPPHRDVADQLNVSVGTVTRAYGALQRQGLVRSEKGRGMFVTSRMRSAERRLDLSINTPPPIVTTRMLSEAITRVASHVDAGCFTRYMAPTGLPEHRQMLARMIAANDGPAFDPSQIIVTEGGQQGIFLTMAAAAPGPLAVEELTYPGALRAARQLQRPLLPLTLDDQGITPESLEAALAGENPPTLLYVVPSVQNPTGAVMGLERRRQIAELARRANLMIIEDDVYSVFAPARLPTLAELAPDHVFYVGSLSKCMAPGLRLGYVAAPPQMLDTINDWLMAMRTTTTPISGMLLSYWMSEGIADAIVQAVRAETVRRNQVARSVLGPWLSPLQNDSLHAWLPMETARARDLVLAASQAGITLAPPDAFMADPGLAATGLRICLGTLDDADLHEALSRLREMLLGTGASQLDMMSIV